MPPAATDTTESARAHARAQAGRLVTEMPTVPASEAREVPADVERDDLVWVETVPGGGYASKLVARGTRLRLTDLEGDACAHLLLHVAAQPFERLCVADTVKVLWSAYLGAGSLLLSDQGRVLASVVGDDSGRHDTMAGASHRQHNERRYGSGAPQGPSPAGRDGSFSPARSTVSRRATFRRASRSSRGSGSRATGHSPSPAPRGPGARSNCSPSSRSSC